MWCGENKWDAIHHIISPSSMDWKAGKFNSSILNGAPIHNSKCHLYNSQLHNIEYERKLLSKVYDALISLGYELGQNDKDFMEAYAKTHYAQIKKPKYEDN
jgi:hypothetical protein